VPRDLSAYDYICTNHGYNDGAADRTDTVAKWLADVRQVNARAAIFLIVPFSGRQRQSITRGAAEYQRANPADKRVFVIDLGDGFYQSVARAYTAEGIHPNVAQSGRLAGAIAGLIQRQLLALERQEPR
jgi:lysophospholipase L1-like esterase